MGVASGREKGRERITGRLQSCIIVFWHTRRYDVKRKSPARAKRGQKNRFIGAFGSYRGSRSAHHVRKSEVKRSAKKFQRVWVAFPESTNHPGGVAGPGYELARSTRPRKSHIRANTVKRSIAPFPRRPWRLGRLVTDHRERHPRPHRQTRACQQSANSPRWRRSCLQACERNAQAHPGQAQQPDFRRRGAHRPMPTALRSAVATLDALVAGCLTPLRFGNRFREPCRRQEALSAATAPLH